MQSLSSNSYWRQNREDNSVSYPPLAEDHEVDVVVIGAGITGLTTALHLKHAGRRVAVLEAGRVGAGTTGGTSGHLEVMPDQGWVSLVRDFGKEAASQVTAVRQQAIDQIENWVRQFGIDCDFRRIPARAYTEREDRADRISQEYETALELKIDVSLMDNAELPFPTAAALEIRNQARFHCLDYLKGLAAAVQGDQVAIYENSRARPPEDGQPCVVEANGHRLRAAHVVLATHSAYLGISQFDLRQAPYQSYVLVARVAEVVPDALYWDDDQPYHYLRLAASGDPHLVIVGGADHKTGQADAPKHARRLENYVGQHFSVERIEHGWSAEFFEPSDGLPFIGRVPGKKHLFLATGFSGTGLTYGTAAGKILADLILGRESGEADVFSPGRVKPLAAAKDFISENLNVAKHFVADRFSAEQVDSLDAVAAGTGRLIKFNGEKYAAYRDADNQLHLLSPACTHAGCYVQWNAVEQTWDCPCHGGRFSATGERMYGPPPSDLERQELPSEKPKSTKS